MGEIGKFERKIQVLNPTTSKSKMGSAQKSFSLLYTVWASRTLMGEAPEGIVNNRISAEYRYKYKTYFKSGINETQRIYDKGVVYNILGVNPIDRIFMEIIAEMDPDAVWPVTTTLAPTTTETPTTTT